MSFPINAPVSLTHIVVPLEPHIAAIIDPHEVYCPSGYYGPREINRDLEKLLSTHKGFPYVGKIEHRPDDGKTYLWLKRDWDSEYAVIMAKRAEQLSWNRQRWEEEARVQRCIARLTKDKPKLHKNVAREMIMFSWEEYCVSKDEVHMKMLKRYGYFEPIEIQ